MKPTLRTRKPVDDLKMRDLKAFPVWEYAMDEKDRPGRDETWVRPRSESFVRKNQWSQLVAADFLSKSGRRFQGFMEVMTDGAVVISPGAIIGRVGYRPIPARSPLASVNERFYGRMREDFVRALKMSDADVFPLRYELRVPIRGEKQNRTGEIS